MHVREEGVQGFLELLDSVESAPNEILYKQWVTVDRCAMIDVVEPLHEYLSSLSKKISSMVRHHFVAQQQSQYFKHLKETLPPESEAIIVGDFSENYSFIVQDAAQGFHWENSQCTVHPFVVYYKSTIHQELSHFSVCFLSLKHNTIMVYSFISKLLTNVRSKCPQLKKVHYFSDGCALQISATMKRISVWHVNGTSLLHHMARMHVTGSEEQSNELQLVPVCRELQRGKL